ncbi:type IV pilus modification PilV family protein [Vibrio astriarenae]
MRLNRGFTLIESVVAIITLAIAMLTITTMLVPSVQRSAAPQYQVRAAALAETLFAQILSRSFDKASDPEGGFYRCGEDWEDSEDHSCSTYIEFGPVDVTVSPTEYKAVDEYGYQSGAWVIYTLSQTTNTALARNLSELISDSDTYKNFEVKIRVSPYLDDEADDDFEEQVAKRIDIEITASSHGPYTFHAYKGNY